MLPRTKGDKEGKRELDFGSECNSDEEDMEMFGTIEEEDGNDGSDTKNIIVGRKQDMGKDNEVGKSEKGEKSLIVFRRRNDGNHSLEARGQL